MDTAHRDYANCEILKLIAKKIRLLRITRGWSQETLATLARLHANYIGRIERAETNIGIVNLAKIADALDVPLYDLLKRDGYTDKTYPRVEEAQTVYYVGHA